LKLILSSNTHGWNISENLLRRNHGTKVILGNLVAPWGAAGR
jgi:hypothetical protein